MKIDVEEVITLDAGSGVRKTPRGYLVAMPRVARMGIQVYRGDEVGKPDMPQVRVYRPEDSVFSMSSRRSYAHQPVTNNHSPVPVTADNWKDYAVGHTGDEVARDGEFIRVPMVLMDAAAVRDYEDGKRELSQGYTMDLHWEAGKTSSGEAYDAVMSAPPKMNHLALVARARGGPNLRIGDDKDSGRDSDWRMTFDEFVDELAKRSQRGEDEMDPKLTKIMIGDTAVEVADVSAQHVLRTITGMETELSGLRSKMEKDKEDAKKAKDEAVAAKDAVIATKDAEIVTLKDAVVKAKPSPAVLDALVVERHEATTKAKALLGDKAPASFAGKTAADIRRAVVDARLGERAKGWSEESVKASFDTMEVTAVKDAAGNVVDPIQQTFQSNPVNVNATDAAWNNSVKDLGEAWKAKPATH